MIIDHVPGFMFLLATRLAAWPRLAPREETWKTAEILMLRHELPVLRRQQPQRPPRSPSPAYPETVAGSMVVDRLIGRWLDRLLSGPRELGKTT